MKKSITLLSVLGIVFYAAGLVLFFFLPALTNNLMSFDTAKLLSLSALKSAVLGLINFASIGVYQIAGLALLGVCALLFIAHIIILIVKKHPISLLASLAWFIGTGALMAAFIIMWNPALFASASALTELEAVPGYQNAPYIFFVIGVFNGMSDTLRVLWMVIAFLPPVLVLVGFVLLLIALIKDMRYLASMVGDSKKPEEYDASGLDSVVVVHEDEVPATQEGAASLGQEIAEKKGAAPAQQQGAAGAYAPAAAEAEYGGISTPRGSSNQAFTGPFLVQYINTYAPEQPAPAEEPRRSRGEVPLSEIQGAITGEKPLTAEDIRKIVREELEGDKKPAQPVIVTVPSPVSKPAVEEEKHLTAEEVRAIFAAELQNALGSDQDILVEPEEPAALSAEEIRSIIANELAAARQEPVVEEEEEPAPISEADVRDVIRQELLAFRESEEEKARQREEEAKRKAEEEAKRQAEIEEAKRQAVEEALGEQKPAEPAPAALTPEEIRQIIAEEFARQAKPEEEEKPAFDPEAIRELLREELRAAKPIAAEQPAPVTVIVKQPDAEPEPEPVVVVAPQPKPEPKPAPVVVAPAAEPEEAGEEGGNKIIRIPFPTRMVEAEDEMKANYNELKSEILSYGVKSRVSNSGDTFRLHKVTFVKITIAGKSLKLYFALDPADYANTTLPIQDASHKNIYREIPLVFKVKSELSMRRAKQLIADVMDRHGLEQGRVELRDYTESLRDYKAAGTREDEDDED